jgi:hypothetical protein
MATRVHERRRAEERRNMAGILDQEVGGRRQDRI